VANIISTYHKSFGHCGASFGQLKTKPQERRSKNEKDYHSGFASNCCNFYWRIALQSRRI